MTNNAPYYQIRDHDYDDNLNAHPYETAEDGEYALPSSIAPSASIYNESAQSHNAMNGYDGHNSHVLTDGQLEQNHNLVELLEAATTAAGQAQVGPERETNDNAPKNRAVIGNNGQTQPTSQQKRGKRKRVSSPMQEGREGNHTTQRLGDSAPSSKRMRVCDPQVSKDPNSPDLDGQTEKASVDGSNVVSPDPDHLSDARAAGVHSAAALFRRPSTQTTKKYTRPPMSKLFISLQLTPENFLHLQAQAKAYMLDSAHPERQNCVGNRGKGDTDMVKLRLFNCVRDFLADGAGERFFGEAVEKPGEREAVEAARALGEENIAAEGRRWVWPRDGNKIISLVTPLLRRMVTNERQRVYAIETRRGGGRRKEGSVDSAQIHENELGMGVEGNGTPFDPTLSPTLTKTHQSHQPTPSPSLSTNHLRSVPQHLQPIPMAPDAGSPDTNLIHIVQRDLPEPPRLFYKIETSLIKNRAKIVPSSNLKVDMATTLDDLMQEVLSLVRIATITYPELTPSKTESIGPETLRGLAVAATAAGLETETSPEQANNPTIDVESEESSAPNDTGNDAAANPKASPFIPYTVASSGSAAPFPPSPALPSPSEEGKGITGEPFQRKSDEILPPFKIKALVSQGLQVIETMENWECAKRDCRDSAWAEGVLKVVVDFDV